MQPEATEALLRSLEWLRDSSEYSDLKIFCGDQVFPTHKALICPRSDFFAKACKWGKDGQSKSEIDLGDEDPKIVKLMIDYLYRLDYDDVLPCETPPSEEPLSKEPDSPVARTIKFFENVALNEASAGPADNVVVPRVPWDYGLNTKEKKKKEKNMRLEGTWDNRLTQYMIDEEDAAAAAILPPEVPSPGLVAEAQVGNWTFSNKKMLPNNKSRLQDFVKDPDAERMVVNAELYAVADKYGIKDLKLRAEAKFSEAAAQKWRSEAFVRAAHLAFQNTPGSDLGLRKVVISTLYIHPELTDYEEVQDLLDSGNGIAWQLVKVLLLEKGSTSNMDRRYS